MTRTAPLAVALFWWSVKRGDNILLLLNTYYTRSVHLAYIFVLKYWQLYYSEEHQ